jgi:hypothetical protein
MGKLKQTETSTPDTTEKGYKMAKLFTLAGVARQTDGILVFRATTRAEYPEILRKEGKTDVNFLTLPQAMDKLSATQFLATQPSFQTAEILALFGATKPAKDKLFEKAKSEGRAARAAAKAPKLTKAAAIASVKRKVEASADEIADIKEKNLETMRKVSSKLKKYNQVAREDGPGVDGFDPDMARAEVATMLAEMDQLDSFKAPEKILKGDLKYII